MSQQSPEFWEAAFTDKQEMWGMAPAASALACRDLFLEHGIKTVLIPGIGYGRNAQPFREQGMRVTGIEISPAAIAMARKHYGPDMTIYEGPVAAMPFDKEQYDGIFCYGLIHLLDAAGRDKLIRDCYSQLRPGGHMVFTTISKAAQTYSQGRQIETDRFEQFGGVTMYFYDEDTIRNAFGPYGLADTRTITENFPFWLIHCHKPAADVLH